MTDSKGAARGRREVLAAGIALLCPAAGSGAASAQMAAGLVQPVGFSPRPGVGMRLTFEYVPARDGLALLTGGPSQAGYAAAAATHPASIWEPRFSTEPNPKGGGNTPNGEYQFYADPEHRWSNGYTPFAIIDGVLRVRAERAGPLGFAPGEIPDDPHTGAPYEWVSGILNSRPRFSQRGGYFEIDARVPKGRATWPAFWLLPVTERHPPEIDVVEHLGHEPTKYRGTLITAGPTENATTYDAGVDLGDAFHKYGILWTDTAITFYLDGVRTASKSIAGSREFSQPFYLLLNLAIGSRKAEWVPAPDGTSPSPVDFLVRSVRAWQRLGPTGIILSSSAIPETAKPGARVATMSCASLDRLGRVTFTLLDDPDGKFRVSGDRLLLRASLSFTSKRYHAITVQAADEQGRTWQQTFSVAVLDAGTTGNQLAAGSERSLAHGAWEKHGVSVLGGQVGPDGSRNAEFLAETPGDGPHAVEQLIPKAELATRTVVSADLKPHGREWVKLEISRNYGKNVQAFFNLATGEIGDHFASVDAAPFILHDCRAAAIGDGFIRCQVDLTTDAGPTLRVAIKLVTSGSDYAPHLGDLARGVISRSLIRVVAVS